MTTIETNFTYSRDTKITTFYDYEPLYPSDLIKTNIRELSLKEGENTYTDSFELKGYDSQNGEYFGFNQRSGYRIATDRPGNALTPANS